MRGVRKILKKFAKNVDPTPPAPGFLALEIVHPHDPNWKLLQVRLRAGAGLRLGGVLILGFWVLGHFNNPKACLNTGSPSTSSVLSAARVRMR